MSCEIALGEHTSGDISHHWKKRNIISIKKKNHTQQQQKIQTRKNNEETTTAWPASHAGTLQSRFSVSPVQVHDELKVFGGS